MKTFIIYSESKLFGKAMRSVRKAETIEEAMKTIHPAFKVIDWEEKEDV